MISSAANVKPESFPPTEQDAMFLCSRYTLNYRNRTNSWKNWEWRLEGALLVPVMTDQAPAPNKLLRS